MNTIPTPQDLHKQLVQELHKKDRLNRCLRNEIKALHRKLRDANRGAERNAWIAHDLAKELVEYKIKHPEKIT